MKMTPELAILLAGLALDAIESFSRTGEITPEQLAEVKAKYDAVGKSWDDRVAAAKLRLSGGGG